MPTDDESMLSKYSHIIEGIKDESFICNSLYGSYTFLGNCDALKLRNGNCDIGESIKQELISKRILNCRDNTTISHESAQANPTAFIIPTYNCNLKCTYCFQHVTAKSDPENPLLMLDYIINSIRMHGYDRNPIYLFGGEPLLKENKDFIEHFLQIIRNNKWKFAIFTNGTNINSYIELIKQYIDHCDHIHVTVDGGEVTHNDRRGSGTYRIIKDNISNLVSNSIPVKVRVNIDPQTIVTLAQFLEDYSDLMASNLFWIYCAAIRESINNIKIDSTNFVDDETRKTLLELKGKYLFSLKNFLGLEFGRHVKENSLLENRSEFYSKKILYDMLGYFYPCICSVAFPQLAVGRIDAITGKISNLDNWWEKYNKKEECSKCALFYFCGGGCNMEWQQNNAYRCQQFIEDNIRFSLDFYLDRSDFYNEEKMR